MVIKSGIEFSTTPKFKALKGQYLTTMGVSPSLKEQEIDKP